MAKLKDSRPIVQKNQDFYDFKGLLGEINSKKNLQEQFGDRYFEFSLRDRYIDEKNKEHEYVYNLTKDNEPSKFLQKAKSTD